jgi:prepilin signal peptidase PulO-like enzyme (type II secretory pathway)
MSAFIVIAIFVTLLGLTFGSFVNAAVWRVREGRAKSLLNDRSECTHCGHKLALNDLIPVVSWLSLRGRCRYCGGKIEDTPLAEISVAVYFLISLLFWPGGFDSVLAVTDFVFWLIYGVGLAFLALYDRRTMLLPNKVVFLLIGLAVIQLLVHVLASPSNTLNTLADAVLGVASIAGIYLVLYVFSRGRWVGFGDVKLGVFLGVVLADWKLGLLTFLLANLIGSLVILPGLATHKLTRSSKVPFGPFLILGFVIAMLFGAPIIDWYTSSLFL